MSELERDFARLVARLDYPMFIVTAAAGGEQSGCLVGFATQASIHPPRFLACLSRKNRTFDVATGAAGLAVHVVGPGDRALAELFGGETGDEVDKFAACDWREGPSGVPVLTGIENWFVGDIAARFDFGDHVGFLLSPVEVHAGAPEPQLGFQEAKDIDPGHHP